MVGPATRPKRADRILDQRTPDDLLLLSLDKGEYYALDDVGGRIWELCDGTLSAAEVVAILSKEYDAPAEVLEQDALELLGDLMDEGLLVDVG